MPRPTIAMCLLFLALSATMAGPVIAVEGFSKAVCSRNYAEPNANRIVREVFEDKYERLLEGKGEALLGSGVLTKSFVERNRALQFAVCDNPGGFDTLSIYGVGVAFDIKLIGLLMAQARALVVAAMINANEQLILHRKLMTAFITQGAKLSINPIKQVENDSLESGMTPARYKELLADPEFQRREQNIFLVALNFLSLHERCHFGLDHGSRIRDILTLPAASRPAARHALEIEADKCAIDIINADESAFAASPISYFALAMTVSTQVIVSAYAPSPETSSHPSGGKRLAEAQAVALRFVAAKQTAGSERYEKYKSTIEGFGTYMADIIALADAMRASRSEGPQVGN